MGAMPTISRCKQCGKEAALYTRERTGPLARLPLLRRFAPFGPADGPFCWPCGGIPPLTETEPHPFS